MRWIWWSMSHAIDTILIVGQCDLDRSVLYLENFWWSSSLSHRKYLNILIWRGIIHYLHYQNISCVKTYAEFSTRYDQSSKIYSGKYNVNIFLLQLFPILLNVHFIKRIMFPSIIIFSPKKQTQKTKKILNKKWLMIRYGTMWQENITHTRKQKYR